MVEMDSIKKNISEAIRLSGVSQKKIAQAIGVSQQTVSHYVRKEKMPSLEVFARLCEVLDVDPADLLSGKNR